MTVLFIGDVIGKPGREALLKKLPSFKRFKGVDLCIANGENSGDNDGVSADSVQELFAAGVDIVTGGNHSFRHREAYELLNNTDSVLRPANCSHVAPGKGVCIYDMGMRAVAVINLIGAAFMEPCEHPMLVADKLIASIDPFVKTVIVDFHAEATAEKRVLAEYLNGRVSAVIGTHTHVQTADETVLSEGTAFITDVGMCGPIDSVIGVKKELAIEKMLTRMPTRFSVASGEVRIDAVLIKINDKTGKAEGIERVQLTA